MTPNEFVRLFALEKDAFLKNYSSGTNDVSSRIAHLQLNSLQQEELINIINRILTDVFYSILLGLDGCAQIGGKQIDYQLADDNGNMLTGKGEIEGYAWENFRKNEK